VSRINRGPPPRSLAKADQLKKTNTVVAKLATAQSTYRSQRQHNTRVAIAGQIQEKGGADRKQNVDLAKADMRKAVVQCPDNWLTRPSRPAGGEQEPPGMLASAAGAGQADRRETRSEHQRLRATAQSRRPRQDRKFLEEQVEQGKKQVSQMNGVNA